jgi:shikimate kinase
VSGRPLVVVVGPPAAGKTRVAKRLGRILDVDVVDTDTEVVKRWGPIPDIFATHGEDFFRTQERDAVENALTTSGVVALGGGAVVDASTQADLVAHRVALISITAEAVAPRLDNDKRPLLTGGLEAWKELVAQRHEVYQAVATREFDASHRSVDDVADEVAAWVREDAEL